MYGIVYKVTNLINNKIYIGQTTRSLQRRKIEHIYQSTHQTMYRKPCTYFHNALTKYGEVNFYWEVLHKCRTKEELNIQEKEEIIKNKSFGDGYNLCVGGNSNAGYKHSKETIEKRKRFRHTIEERKRMSRRMLGTHISEETKAKLRKANLGKKYSEESCHKRSISLKGKNNKRIKCSNGEIYDSLSIAAQILKCKVPGISKSCHKHVKHKGYNFEFI